jgi:hypothetical protein
MIHDGGAMESVKKPEKQQAERPLCSFRSLAIPPKKRLGEKAC